ncbi:VUT family protein [Ornithinibacillus hominis]|uniref:VUT family protein n=1 Tax=Ornithinibacillus hominis TaxID=2763055 RepID=A0A923RFU7_9BACI|nr:VUT family protein [Ornithinibacillus hominis]MBC5635288.1 VUT family protein [Ornithinibacillus hominis]
MRIFLYLLSIVVANVITAKFAPLVLGVFIIPMGTLFIGATFILRDLVQMRHGRKKTYMIIFTALIISGIVSYLLGDTLMIVAASALSFIVAETADTEIYTRLKLPIPWRVFYSGLVGGFLDSVVFIVIGLSPIGANILPWAAIPGAIAGQIMAKTLVQMIGALILNQFYQIRGKRITKNSYKLS